MNNMDILLVEDSSADAYLFRDVISRNGFAPDIHWVVDGHYALDYIFQRRQYQHVHRPDMIVLDLNLPRISGYEVLKELKNSRDFSDIPIAILTTSRDPLDRSQCQKLGADVCFSKPHALKQYESMIDQLINWARPRIAEKAQETKTPATV